tara:strand:- start:113 stop:859 length:747 start_codon:yes stop_codon:yes gene_type:complete
MTFKCIKKILFNRIEFLDIDIKEFDKLILNNGLFVFPSGPGLATIDKDTVYHKSLINADYVFFDSGFFVLLLKFLKKIKVKKFSGYLFLKNFFYYLRKNKNITILCIDPDKKKSLSNSLYLKSLGNNKVYSYIAPFYNVNKIHDKELLLKIELYKPDIVITNIGGGTQEVLGYYIKQNIKYKIKIFCTGAAISFFTGEQAPINSFIDKLYVGWLLRIFHNPKIFLMRYFKSIRLFKIVYLTKVKIIDQ